MKKQTPFFLTAGFMKPGGLLGRSVRYDNWRYTEWGSPSKNELYDLDRDPNEYANTVSSA